MENNNPENHKLILKRYKIIKKIATGGMADVYLGDDLKLGRKVAIKVLSSNYASDKNFVARFKSEAQILARLSHPNIVQIYDWGEYDSSYFICIEYIEGESLKEIIEKKGPLPHDTAADYAIQISSALYLAHKNNLVHRDIKPQNILVTPEGKIKVTDFGIAKSISTDVTRTLNIIGTAHYISPEQAKGEILDNRTDIYSLGIVMYEMLTADVPFRGGSSIDISLKHIYEKPLKPSELINNIPEKLEKIVMHCIEKESRSRYPDIKELIWDLQNYQTDKPLSFNNKPENLKRALNFNKKDSYFITSIITGVLMLIFLILSIIYGYKYYNTESLNPSDIISVPPIENIPLENADKILTMFGLKIILKNEAYDPEIPEGFIIEQNPGPGENVKAGGDIQVVISRGPEDGTILTPNLIGLSLEDARIILNNNELAEGNIIRNYSEIFKENTVIKHTPEFNEPIKPGEPVNLTVSKGEELILIPNIIGEDYTEALNYLTSLGFIVESSKSPIKEGDIINEPGKIVEVVPSAGSRIEVNSLVKLIISSNESLVMVPDLTQLSLEEAINILDSASIAYEISYVDTNYAIEVNTVLNQIPEAGTYVSPNSSVILFTGS
jgi:eukaryotic-like serine/threonine-protein kinase